MRGLLPILLIVLVSCATAETDYTTTYAQSVEFNQIHEDTIRLGAINEGETVTTGFMIKNRTGRTLNIDFIESGCGCTTAVWSKDPIKDGCDIPVTLFFNSSGQFGKQFKTIEVHTSDNMVGKIHLAIEVKF